MYLPPSRAVRSMCGRVRRAVAVGAGSSPPSSHFYFFLIVCRAQRERRSARESLSGVSGLPLRWRCAIVQYVRASVGKLYCYWVLVASPCARSSFHPCLNCALASCLAIADRRVYLRSYFKLGKAELYTETHPRNRYFQFLYSRSFSP